MNTFAISPSRPLLLRAAALRWRPEIERRALISIAVVLALIGAVSPLTRSDENRPLTRLFQAIEHATGMANGDGRATHLGTTESDALTLNFGDQVLSVDLPGESTSVAARGQTLLYPYAGKDYSVASQALSDNSARGLVTLTGPDAPTRYPFRFALPEGQALISGSDGGVNIVGSQGQVVGQIEKPWAVDATERSIPTHYELEGTTLIQVVHHDGASYPVIADPYIRYHWWGMSFQFSKWETQVIALGAGAVSAYFGWSGILAVVAFAAHPFAVWATRNGYCLAINRSWSGFMWPWYYRC